MTTSNLAQQISEYIASTRNRKLDEASNSPVFQKPKTTTPPTAKKAPSRLYSNSLTDCVKTFCCECDQQVRLSGLRKHLAWHHKHLSMLQYIKLYGQPKKQIIKMVYHNCALCKKDIVHDYNAMLNHLKKRVHKTNMAKYVREYMDKEIRPSPLMKPMTSVPEPSKHNSLEDGTRIEAVAASAAPIAPDSPFPCLSPSSSPMASKSPNLPSISPSCSPCSRVFRSNMEFKMHRRRIHA